MNTTSEFRDIQIIKSERKVLFTVILVAIIFVGKFSGALLTNSLALFSDSWHLLTDIAALIISWWGLKVSSKPATSKYTFGYYRYSILTSLINNVSLIVISLYIFYKAVLRFIHPSIVKPEGMIIFSILGLIINCIIVFGLRGSTQNLSVRSVFLHFLGDALSDMGVLIGGIIIMFTHTVGIDTLLSSILACLILKNAVTMTIECVKILVEAAPENISINEIRNEISKLEGVVSVTDIHVWSLSAEIVAMTAHVRLKDQYISRCDNILQRIQNLLNHKFAIKHSTIQIEYSKHDGTVISNLKSGVAISCDNLRRKNPSD